MQDQNSQRTRRLASLAFGDGTLRKAVLTALVVGTLLIAINHGETILKGQYPPLIKVLLTYCVPFCVTIWGAVSGKLVQAKRQNMEAAEEHDTKSQPL